MSKRLKKTKDDETPSSNPYDALESELDKVMVDMRVEGYPMTLIATKAKLKHQTVKDLFMNGGRLHDAWKYRARETAKEFRKQFAEIDKIIKHGAVLAALKEIEAVQTKGTWPGTMMAAKDLLSRAGFDATSKVTADVTHKTDTNIVESIKTLDDIIGKLKNSPSID